MIHRLPAIGISAFSAIVVAAPIAMLLNALTSPASEPSATRRAAVPVEITRQQPPQAVTPATPAAPALPQTDGSTEPTPEELREKTE